MRIRRPIKCVECGLVKGHVGFGLCRACYTRRWRLNPTILVQCSRCNQTKQHAGNGRCAQCNHVVYHHQNKSFRNIRRRENTYGLSRGDFVKMLERQENKCDICKEEFEDSPKSINVDHCHATGRVRSLLCHRCNIKLGGVEDAPFREKALAYLQKHQ